MTGIAGHRAFAIKSQPMEDLTLLWIPAGLLFILGAVILMFLLT
jgi:hypothetical protein